MELRCTHFPYCLRRTTDGCYILLNRNYKPLGNQSGEWINYDTDPSASPLNITAAVAKKLSWDGSENLGTIYLYNDGCTPTDSAEHMAAYLKRISVLMKLERKAAQ